MSGHSRWWLKTPIEPNADVLLANYVDGYILAMEDVLRDIENMQYDAAEAGAEYFNGYGDALDSLKRQAEESRDSARRTLDVLTKKVDDAAE
jgi:hypothetical protein